MGVGNYCFERMKEIESCVIDRIESSMLEIELVGDGDLYEVNR